MFMTTIHFSGNCDEAIAYYKEILGAEVKNITYFKDRPAGSGMDDIGLDPNFVMHSVVSIRGSSISMTDGATTKPSGDNYTFFITEETEDAARALWDKLLVGGKVLQPLGPVFWAEIYGMVEDKFGVTWQVMTSDGL